LIEYAFFLKLNEQILQNIFLWLFKNIIISGCLIYPVEKTCIKVLYWHNNKETINEKISGEAWAKGWPQNQNLKITQKEFIEDFRWLSSWKYHLIYIIKKLALFFTILLFIVIIFINLKKKRIFLYKKYINYKEYFIFTICSVGSVAWFIKAPLYRYGFSYTISSLLLMISYLLVKFFNFNQKLLYRFVRSIFFLCIVTILLLQLPRIIKNYQIKSHNYWPNIFLLNSSGKKINPVNKKIINGFGIYSNGSECWYSKAPCSNYEINDLHVNFYNSYIIISRFVN
jgi:hypothetical protein